MTRRSERLGDEVRQELAAIIDRQLKDPRVGFVTVTRVRLTADLRSARVYVGVLGDEPARERSLAGLQSAVGFLRRQLGRRLRLRYTPELAFFYDEGLDATERVAQLLTEYAPETPPIAFVERFAFYERARSAFAVVMTGDTRKYANIVLKKGVA